MAYALSDSPVGQLAWIVEEFGEWTDSALPEEAVDRDRGFRRPHLLRARPCNGPCRPAGRALDRDGRFAAMEEPDLLVEDVRAFFRQLREKG